jgi:hypothetical protein
MTLARCASGMVPANAAPACDKYDKTELTRRSTQKMDNAAVPLDGERAAFVRNRWWLFD